MFTLKHLGYLVAAADHRSVTGAARALNVSQPSISAAIAHLEAGFGVQLFIRHHAQGLSLTPAGRRLVTEARSLLAHADDLRQGALDLGESLSGELDVGCFITFAPLVMPALLRSFAARFPDTRVRLHEAHVEGVLDDLRSGRFELAVTYDLNLGPDLVFEPLVDVPLHALLPVDHRLAAAPAVSLHELVAEPFILLGLPQSREYFLAVFYSLRLEPRTLYETLSFEMVRGMVAHGHGYSILHSRPASETTLDGTPIVYRSVLEPVRPARLGIVRLARTRPTRMASAFAEFCTTYFASSPTSPDGGPFGARLEQP